MASVDAAALIAWMDANKITTPEVRAEIVDLGAVEPDDLTDLEEGDIDELCAQMKKLEAKRFRQAVEELKAVGGASPASAVDVLGARGSNLWDVFLSHVQVESGDMCSQLADLLTTKGLNIWYDQWGGQGKPPAVINVTRPGMVSGVQQTACLVLILTKSIFTRPFCRLEILTAIKAGKPIITLMEMDERFGKFDFAEKTRNVPACFWPIVEKICDEICAFPLRRHKEEREVTLNRIVNSYTAGLATVIRCTEQELVAAEAALPEPDAAKAAAAAPKVAAAAPKVAAKLYTEAEALVKLRDTHGAKNYGNNGPPTATSVGFDEREDITTIEGDIMDCLLCLPTLEKLSFYKCENLISLPEGFGQLKSLTSLDLQYCESLISLSEGFGELKSLTSLDLGWCKSLVSLSEGFGDLKSLTSLDLTLCKKLVALPERFGDLKSLTSLDLRVCSKLVALPERFGELKSLTSLNLQQCYSLVSLSEGFGQLKNLKTLNLEGCQALGSLPAALKAQLEAQGCKSAGNGW